MKENDTAFDLDGFLPYQLAVVASRISRQFATLYQERFGISIPEWRVIAHLSQAGSVSVREIHQRVDMDKSKVSRAASKLEDAGYVTKRENKLDRRLIELTLTAKGNELVKEMAPLAETFQRQVLEHLGDKADSFAAALARLLSEPDDTAPDS